jgi:hypothetical protein
MIDRKSILSSVRNIHQEVFYDSSYNPYNNIIMKKSDDDIIKLLSYEAKNRNVETLSQRMIKCLYLNIIKKLIQNYTDFSHQMNLIWGYLNSMHSDLLSMIYKRENLSFITVIYLRFILTTFTQLLKLKHEVRHIIRLRIYNKPQYVQLFIKNKRMFTLLIKNDTLFTVEQIKEIAEIHKTIFKLWLKEEKNL